MEKIYDPKKVEEKIYKEWEEGGYFKPRSDKDPDFHGEPFTIPIPPPNVTGSLHTGHAYMIAIEDLLTRYKRMRGFDALWVPGTDHAGIATQNVVEKKLAVEGKTRHDLGREKFIAEVWKWKEVYHKNITSQIKALGASCDWNRERFTLDEGLAQAVKHAFVTLYNRDLIYRGEYMINWCPRCRTVLADDEAEHEETKGNLWFFKYPLKNNPEKYITVATTRPETMLGDTAVAVSPKDKRYKNLIGAKVILPIVNREIEIIADLSVDQKFGTGAVKITPAHDPNDYQMALIHNLPFIQVIGFDGIMTKEAGEYSGFDRYEAREAIVEEMDKLNLLERVDPHSHAVGHCYRCHTVIEPMISKQWFVRSSILAKKAIASILDKELGIIPKRFEKVYIDWLENMRDWCISRQLWWGHQIPVWYCQEKLNDKCKKKEGVIVSEEEPNSCIHCGSKKIEQDPDVLDTWFSSALWPFSTLGWPKKTHDYKHFYPTTVLNTAYDILFFWVARMTMMGLELTGKSPFEKVYLHGLIRDEKGRKMSKSLGNVVNPLEFVDKYSADALRMTYLTGASPGNDVNLSEAKIKGNRNFTNKLWNIARYISSCSSISEYGNIENTTDVDKWIMAELQKTIAGVTKNLEAYRFSNAGEEIVSFVWDLFADWYIELSKANRNDAVLYLIFKDILKLLHPFIPFITEELWSEMGYKQRYGKLLIEEVWPKGDKKLIDNKAVKEIGMILIEIIKGVRRYRVDQGIGPATKFQAVIVYDPKNELNELLKRNKEGIIKMARVEDILVSTEKTPAKAGFLASGYKFTIIGETADISKVKENISSEIVKSKENIKRLENRLKNKEYVRKAPKEIVLRDKDNLKKIKEELDKLIEELKNL